MIKAQSLKHDVISGFVVFLVAIPLCLGIALASGAPLFSGVIAGVIGGIVVGLASNSHVSVAGPAAGMVAVVISAIAQLGDFNSFLLALFFAGIFQIAIGYYRAGFFADYIPSNVIQGLLCAIGILLIIKQLPLTFTHASSIAELKTLLLETTEDFQYPPFGHLLRHVNEGALVITLMSFAIMIYFEKTRNVTLKKLPASVIVVVAAILLNELFTLMQSPLAQTVPHLVDIPTYGSTRELWSQLAFPNWHAWFNPKVYLYALVIAAVASLESLLNVKAAEKLDKQRRSCSKDRELIAQGIGNMFSGLVGGLPITSVVVRSSVNVQSGAQSKQSTIFHGLFLLCASILLPDILNKIPLSALASILIFVGFKLTSPKVFKEIYQQGGERFMTFIVTTVAIVVTNLLIGILAGLAVSSFYILKKNSQVRLDIVDELHPKGTIKRIILQQQMTFLNKAFLIAELEGISNDSMLIIDASQSNYIDKEIIEVIHEFKEQIAPHKNISLNLVGFKENYALHDRIDFIPVTTYDEQALLDPLQVLNILKEGNKRFLNDTRINRAVKLDMAHTAEVQHPIAVVLGCIDSRVPVETIFDMGFGDIFCVRVAGNIINHDVLGSIEYACRVAGAKLIVVLGHTNCGAIKAACDGVELGHITQLLSKVQDAIEAETETMTERNSENQQYVRHVTELNVAHSMREIGLMSSEIQSMIDDNAVGIVGAIYDISSGEVAFKDFSPQLKRLEESVSVQAREIIEDIKLIDLEPADS